MRRFLLGLLIIILTLGALLGGGLLLADKKQGIAIVKCTQF